MIPFSIIVALDENRGIGKDGTLPWNIPQDMKHFKSVTTETGDSAKVNAVIMGRKTWESIPDKFRPLAGRINCVLTKNENYDLPEEIIKATDFEQIFNVLSSEQYKDKVDEVFVIGGAQVYQEALLLPQCLKLYVTHISSAFDCTSFFPKFEDQFELKSTLSSTQGDGALKYSFDLFERRS